MSYEHISLDQTDAIATLTLRRPASLNALHAAALDELIHAVDRVRDEGSARVLVMTGEGRAFSSGADLGGESSGPDAGLLLERGFNPLLERLFELPLPFITAVNGPAAGAGCSLALAGDIVLAARSAYFLQAFVNIGLVPDAGATWLLPRLAGRARAHAMMMLGERVGAEQAEQWGMIWRVVDDAALASTTHELAGRLAKGPTQAYRLLRQGLRSALESSLTETLRIERVNQMHAANTQDFVEGVAAFRAKRAPAFQGK